MTLVYATFSGKGGAGKTTLGTLIAGEHACRGDKVLLVDADPSQNLQAWWSLSGKNNMQPENVDFTSSLTKKSLDNLISRKKSDYEIILIDTAGRDDAFGNSILEYADVVLTPVQPSKREVDFMYLAGTTIDDFNHEHGRDILHLLVRTRVSLTNRTSEAYRFIRPFVEKMREDAIDSRLLDTELVERGPYRDLANGHGTLQMQDLTEPVKKARLEVMQLLAEIEAHLPAAKQAA